MKHFTLILLFVSQFCFAENDSVAVPFLKPQVVEYFNERGVKIDSLVPHNLYQISYDWMGTRYRYSGKNSKGIDCSGFTKMIYLNVFYDTLSGGSADLANRVELIPKSELKVGDMVFFRIKRKRVSHVGVYLGNDKFVHAAVKGGVQINDLKEDYYRRYFYKGGRNPKKNSASTSKK